MFYIIQKYLIHIQRLQKSVNVYQGLLYKNIRLNIISIDIYIDNIIINVFHYKNINIIWQIKNVNYGISKLYH